jgi:hypothetical protein
MNERRRKILIKVVPDRFFAGQTDRFLGLWVGGNMGVGTFSGEDERWGERNGADTSFCFLFWGGAGRDGGADLQYLKKNEQRDLLYSAKQGADLLF